ncbi:hypothetical protein RSSM_05944 [Rhodopirellula sallentina SM41]|uniref:Uncharacterized protein n=1 Tax=Rhodopirellula sallentina SM41 TaxID=1263870 RepID=M5U9G9_9BACT|nr:hypothetical protein RSSM_05944 [Rhodopirellula sallentina SM41]
MIFILKRNNPDQHYLVAGLERYAWKRCVHHKHGTRSSAVRKKPQDFPIRVTTHATRNQANRYNRPD